MNVLDSIFNQKFTADDVVQIMKKRGIKFEREDENYISIDYSDSRFDIFVRESRLTIRLVYSLGNSYDTLSTLLAMNKVHNDRWSTKLHTVNNERVDQETGERNSEVLLVALYTGWCFSKSSFNKQFDFAVSALDDSANLFNQYYGEYEEVRNASRQNPIGFNASHEVEKEDRETKMNGKNGKIGFV